MRTPTEEEEEKAGLLSSHDGSKDIHSHDQHANSYTVAEAIDAYGFGKYNYLMLLACSTCWIACCMVMESVTWILQFMEDDPDTQLTDTARGMIAISVPLGFFVSGMYWGFLLDYYGRSQLLIISLWLLFVFHIASAFSTS
jgi:MFS family permease